MTTKHQSDQGRGTDVKQEEVCNKNKNCYYYSIKTDINVFTDHTFENAGEIMRIVIVGAGKLGYSLAEYLTNSPTSPQLQ